MIVGTAGHIDHGKTALVKALTGVDADRLADEKARGITIDLGFAYLPLEGGRVVGFVDVPGHERFVHNMLAGAAGIDAVLLVVAADDGPMPQTIEHLHIVDLLGIRRGLVALAKADLADADRRAEVAAAISDLIGGTGLEGSEIVPVSALTGEGLDEVRVWLRETSEAVGARATEGRFRLAVDRCFTVAGAGTVVTGTVFSGRIGVGGSVHVLPSGLGARIRAIHAQNRPAEAAVGGQRCALNLAGAKISREAIHRGDWVVDPATQVTTVRLDATCTLLASEPRPLAHWTPVHLHLAASHVPGRVALLQDEPIRPGERGLIQLVLDRPIAALWGDRFVLRDTSARRTMGGGLVLDVRAPRRRRRTPERLAALGALAEDQPAAALGRRLAQPPGWIDFSAFVEDRNLAAPQQEALARREAVVRLRAGEREIAMAAAGWTGLRARLRELLVTFHRENPDLAGIPAERLRLVVPERLPGPTFATALQVLAKAGAVALDGAWVRLPEHTVRLKPEDERLWHEVAPFLQRERFRPPRVRDIANDLGIPEAAVRRLMKLLARMGRLEEVAHDHFFLRTTVAEMAGIAAAIAAGKPSGEFTAADLRDRLDNGRKVAIQILEFFDRHGVTLRRGDLRRVSQDRVGLFGEPAPAPTEGNRSRWSGRTSNPDGAVSRSLVGSTPTPFRHSARERP
jgi:selenocysteine-specific elongation factor